MMHVFSTVLPVASANNPAADANLREAMMVKRLTEQATTPARKLSLIFFLAFWSFKRLFMAFFGESFPSPFTVLNLLVMKQFRRRLINSLDTYIKLKCICVTKLKPLQEVR